MAKLNEPPHEKAVFKMVSIPGSAGEVWFTTGASAVHGITGELYRTRDGFETLEAVSGFTDVVSCGFGKEAPGRTNVTLYVIGAYNEQFGIYRSIDNGNNWVMISDFTGTGAMANGPGTICGDMHDFGVLYVCSGGSGVFYGRPMGTVVEPLGVSEDVSVSEASSVIDVSFNVNGGAAVKTKGYKQEGALYFPVRDLFDLLKAKISWDDETNTATVSRDVLETVVYRTGAAGNKVTQKFELTAQSNGIVANGRTVELGAAVKLLTANYIYL
jgi:hypothetical protein